jgi:hypothetical protein
LLLQKLQHQRDSPTIREFHRPEPKAQE